MVRLLLIAGAIMLAGCAADDLRVYEWQQSSDHWELQVSVEELAAGDDQGEEVLITAEYRNESAVAENVRITSLSAELDQNEMASSSVDEVEAGETVEQERRGSAQNPAFLGSIVNEEPIIITLDWHEAGEARQETFQFQVEE
ncbi:hypothetical protein [Alkalicoccus luteus]|uniref:Uncharacterized protein n=1 Tax=Alkalicoccus luteus TaxID=1237094 RepID=A0A969TXR1_9BACI|nr:hypothetical protein [Alkalicoccus luteus]NJP38454.1 hypothetical protein [Alkalicoccus luteus]